MAKTFQKYADAFNHIPVIYDDELGIYYVNMGGSVVLTDENGNPINASNPLPVDVRVEIGTEEVQGTQSVGDIASNKPVGIGGVDTDGKVKRLKINNDGTLPVDGTIQGKQAVGTTPTSNPVLIGAVKSDDNTIQYVKLNKNGELSTNASGGASVGGGNSTYSNLQGDFTAVANVGAKTITLTGLRISIASINISSAVIIKWNSGTGLKETLDTTAFTVVDNGGGSYTITLPNISNFVANDQVNVAFSGKDKFSDVYNSTLYVQVLNTPVQGEPAQWVNTTNIAAGTNYYPSTNGEIQEGSAPQFYLKIIGGTANTVTVTFENIEDASNVTTPTLISDITDLCIVSGLNKTNTTAALQITYANGSTGNATFAVAAGQTLECMISLPDFSYTRLRAKVVTTNGGSASNTGIIVKQNKPIGN
jgi:hypothetical protein